MSIPRSISVSWLLQLCICWLRREIFQTRSNFVSWLLQTDRPHNHMEPADNPTRKHGALARNISSNCTVKDEATWYYGSGTDYYGGNVGSGNSLSYVDRFAKDPY